jgi:hypothetical protein
VIRTIAMIVLTLLVYTTNIKDVGVTVVLTKEGVKKWM